MPDPLRLLHAMSRVTDRVHIWSQYVDTDAVDQPWASPTKAKEDVTFMGRTVTYYRRTYNDAASSNTYCGGVYNEASWLTKQDILEQLRIDGFSKIEINFDAPNINGPSFALVAHR